MHVHIQRYCGDDGREARLPQAVAVEIIQKLLHQGLKRAELRDELYMQLVKQTRCNPLPHSRARAWELFTLIAAAMPPSKVRGRAWAGRVRRGPAGQRRWGVPR